MATTRSLSPAQRLVIEYYKAKLNVMHVINARWAVASAIDLFQRPYARPRRKNPPIWKKAHPLFLISGTEKLAGLRWLPAVPNGKKMLVVHGFAGANQSFDRYISAALAKGYEVIAYDAPGHGKSTGKRLNLVTYQWVMQDILKHHGGFDTYLAHSLGGMSLMLALESLGFKKQDNIILMAPLVEAKRAIENFLNFLQVPVKLQAQFEEELATRAGHPMHWYSLPRLVRSHQGNILWVHDTDDETTPFIDVVPLQQETPQHLSLMITEGLGHSRIYRDNRVRKRILEML